MSLKEKLRAGFERRFITVSVPLIGDVRLRSLTSAEMRRLRNSLCDDDAKPIMERLERANELLAVESIVDEAGVPIFTEDDAMNGTFDTLDGAAAKVLFTHVVRHTGWNANSDWKEIEGAAKN